MITLNKEEVDFGSFPNGELYLDKNKLNIRSYNYVVWTYEGDDDFFKLALLKAELDKTGKSALRINYMPHSRMDRENPNYVMSLRPATALINALLFDYVDVVEPHSDVTPGMLNRCNAEEWCQSKLEYIIEGQSIDTLFLPDAGASKRYISPIPSAVGYKQRDFKTGEITKFDLNGEVGQIVLIVDDLCSKGGTFVHSAKLLRQHDAKVIYLLVANCESTVMQGELFDNIDHMFVAKHNKINIPVIPTRNDTPLVTFI